MSQRGKFIKKIAFAKRPVEEKTKFLKNGEVKVKRSCHRRGRCFALFFGLRLPLLQAFRQLSHAFFVVYILTAGRVNLKLLKMKKVMFTAFVVGLGLTANVFLPGQVMAQVPNYVPTNGLVGWWPFNGNANDESGNGNNGTVSGATLALDRFGLLNSAYDFNGIYTTKINVNLTLQLSGTKTYSLWFKVPVNFINPYCHLITCNNSGSEYLALNGNEPAYVSAGVVGKYYDGKTSLPSSIFLNDNNWHHLVLIHNYQSSTASLFIDGALNGVLISSNFNTNPIISQLAFGSSTNNSLIANSTLNGNLDDIGIWNRALNECEIQDLYNSQLNSVTGSISVSPQPATIGSSVLLSTAWQTQNVQWQSNPSNFGWQNVPNNANYSGGTTNTLTVSNVQLSNHNQPFRVISSAGNCTDTSNVASILIADTCITNVTVYDTLLTTVTDTLIINTTLSLPAPNNENTILIYPNPASDHITIDNGNFSSMAGYTIKIENNAGQQVFQSLINQAQFYVDLSTWTGNGLYFVHLIDPQNNTVTVRKIVLQ